MTAVAGAPLTRFTHWKAIDWKTAENQVSRLQLRIAKAIKIGRYAKAKALQWLLTHSFFAKLLAIKRVTQNTGKRTPGVDGGKKSKSSNSPRPLSLQSQEYVDLSLSG